MCRLCIVRALRIAHTAMLPFRHHLVVDGWARSSHTQARIYYLSTDFILSPIPVTQLVIIVRDDTHWLRRRSHSNAQIPSFSIHILCASCKHSIHNTTVWVVFSAGVEVIMNVVCVCVRFSINLFIEREKQKSRRNIFFSLPAGFRLAIILTATFFASHCVSHCLPFGFNSLDCRMWYCRLKWMRFSKQRTNTHGIISYISTM